MSALYVIAAADAVKIGWAFAPERRLRELQTGHHQELTLTYSASARHPGAAERWAHKLLREHWLRGEWFAVPVERARWAVDEAIRQTDSIMPLKDADTVASYIIDKFGGCHALARALGHRNATTVHKWKQAGVIPVWRWYEVGQAAERAHLGFDIHWIGRVHGDYVSRRAAERAA
jgi:hypothetical protein